MREFGDHLAAEIFAHRFVDFWRRQTKDMSCDELLEARLICNLVVVLLDKVCPLDCSTGSISPSRTLVSALCKVRRETNTFSIPGFFDSTPWSSSSNPSLAVSSIVRRALSPCLPSHAR